MSRPLPSFQKSHPARLMIERGDLPTEPATTADVIAACAELPESEQRKLALAICPDLERQIGDADKILERVAALGGIVEAAREYDDKHNLPF